MLKANSPYSLLMSTTPAVTGPTAAVTGPTAAVTGPTAGKDTNSGLNFRLYILYSLRRHVLF